MSETVREALPKVAQSAPYPVEVKAGEKYWWCACGLSAAQPFCDGAHKGTGLKSLMWKAEKDETVWLCGCKRTKTPPFCDGSHNELLAGDR
ncbi:MAG: CDGSH iron-sulfur domain-containing protein [Elioraea sp.]|nr:CDGSH iron-sulfur domain-containing protein [Elioraea sp.]